MQAVASYSPLIQRPGPKRKPLYNCTAAIFDGSYGIHPHPGWWKLPPDKRVRRRRIVVDADWPIVRRLRQFLLERDGYHLWHPICSVAGGLSILSEEDLQPLKDCGNIIDFVKRYPTFFVLSTRGRVRLKRHSRRKSKR